jgi:sec-independent protein translocase protein TatC
MAFTDHIEELRWHIIRSLLAVIICAIIAFFNIEWIFDRIIMGPAHDSFISTLAQELAQHSCV